ncbi:PorP/SprF family type IX secretion system membrane protein [Sinomicrobium sp.]
MGYKDYIGTRGNTEAKIGNCSIFSLILLLCGMHAAFAQQTASFPEYNENPFIVNPAYAGMGWGAQATLAHSGFVDNSFEGSAENSSLSFHLPLSQGKMGLGAAAIRDKIGVTTNTRFYIAYSYKIFFDLKRDRPSWQIYHQNVLSFGLTAGVHQLRDNLLELGIADDPLFAENIHASIPTVGVGLLYNNADFYIGVSAPNVLGDKLASRNDLQLSNPVYAYAGYRFYLNEYKENIILKPNLLLKREKGAPLQLDLNLAASFQNKFEIGAGYRSNSAVNFLAGIQLFRQLRILYHYNLGAKNALLGNTHGILLSYNFNNN